jgi:hypothetical protein
VARRLLFALPAIAVGIVLWAVLTAGAPGPVSGIQVLGGPSRAGPELSLLLRALTSDGGRARPLGAVGLLVRVQNAGSEHVWSGVTDSTGHAELWLDLGAPSSDPSLRVESTQTGEPLAEGALVLDASSWQRGVRRQGGWLPGRTGGELLLRVAPEQGVLAVPFEAALVVRVTTRAPRDPSAESSLADPSDREGTPLAGARFIVECEGCEGPAAPQFLTDSRGEVRVQVVPREHAVALRLRAEAPRDGEGPARSGTWYGALPVVPGALSATLSEGRLTVRAPTERDLAFLSVVTETARLSGAIVSLLPLGDGGARGAIDLSPRLRAAIEREPTWVVVSSEDDKRSPGVVGWPVPRNVHEPGRLLPHRTFDAPDRLLVDGLQQRLAEDGALRQKRRQRAALLLIGVGVALGLLLLYEVRGQPRRAHSLESTPGPCSEPQRDEVPSLLRTGWIVGVAVALVVLAVAALAHFALAPR